MIERLVWRVVIYPVAMHGPCGDVVLPHVVGGVYGIGHEQSLTVMSGC